MVWPLYPIIVYDKVRVTCLTMLAIAQLFPFFGFASSNAFWLGPVLVGLCLRFLFSPHLKTTSSAAVPNHNKTTTKASYERRRGEVEAVCRKICGTPEGKLRMFKGTPSNTFRHEQIDTRASREGKLDLSSFCHVLEETLQPEGEAAAADSVESEYATVDVEASTTFETFVEVLLKRGYMPLVVPELRSITVGGAVVGIGVESSSFKYGFFHEGLLEADILLGDKGGRVVTTKRDHDGKHLFPGPTIVAATSKNEYKDLFAALPNSLGSFGYLLRLKMRVRRVKEFVAITKTLITTGADDLVKACEVASTAKEQGGRLKNDFVDAVALSCTGGVSDFSWSSGNCFYKSLFDRAGRTVTVDYLTTEQYIWRWDADWFWCTQIFPGLQNRWVRYLCGPELLRSDQYKLFNDKFTKNFLPKWLQKNQELVIQDIEVPVEKSGWWLKEHCRVVQSDLFGKIKLDWPKAVKVGGAGGLLGGVVTRMKKGGGGTAETPLRQRKRTAAGGDELSDSTDSSTVASSPAHAEDETYDGGNNHEVEPKAYHDAPAATDKTKSASTVPIWLCPVKGTKSPLMPMKEDHLYINFGFWDALEDTVNKGDKCTTLGGNETGLVNRALEAICDENGAVKTLYSTCYYSEAEFYAKYNGKHYEKVKAKYDPEGRSRSWFARVRGK
eukprot:g9503.t1